MPRPYNPHGVHESWMVDPWAKDMEIWQRQEDNLMQQGIYGVAQRLHSSVLAQASERRQIFK